MNDMTSDKEASKAVLAMVIEETTNALKALIDDVEIESGSNAEGLLANLSQSVVRVKKIIEAADDSAVELRYLLGATYDCKCDASVGMAPCFECSLNDKVRKLLAAIDLPVDANEDGVEEGPTLKEGEPIPQEVMEHVTTLFPEMSLYDKWVKSLSKHMSEEKARELATELFSLVGEEEEVAHILQEETVAEPPIEEEKQPEDDVDESAGK